MSEKKDDEKKRIYELQICFLRTWVNIIIVYTKYYVIFSLSFFFPSIIMNNRYDLACLYKIIIKGQIRLMRYIKTINKK